MSNKIDHIATDTKIEKFQKIVTQHGVVVVTENWKRALKNMLSQNSDIILIGDIRDKEKTESSVSLAKTDYLCFTTLHAHNSNQTLNRIINFFPEEKIQQFLMKC